MGNIRVHLAMALILAASTPSYAQTPHACASVRAAAERLACYDKAFPPVGDAEQLKSSTERETQARRDFGLSPAMRGDSAANERIDRVEGVVKSVEHIEGGMRLVVLETGETWLLTEATRSGPLQEGERVEIKSGLLRGTFVLTTPRKVNLRARRIR